MKRKEEIIEEIKKLTEEYNSISLNTSGMMFLLGDTNEGKSMVITRGNLHELSQSFNRQMNDNAKFNQILTSMFGAYLRCNSQFREQFIRVVNDDLLNIGIN